MPAPVPPSVVLRHVGRVIAPVAVLTIAFALLPLRGSRAWLWTAVGSLLLIGTIPVMVRQIRRVRTSSTPLLDVAGAIVLLLAMIIFGFAAIYYRLADIDDASFDGLDTKIDAVYFTVVTLSTVGFGDVTPASQAARLLVTVQVVVNLAFLGVAVRFLARVAQDRRTAVHGDDWSPGGIAPSGSSEDADV